MKPIIVTYKNESFLIDSKKITKVGFGYMSMQIPNGGFYFANKIISHEGATIYESDIKLIARPKQINAFIK